jgi:hypothetical protein
MPEIEKMPSSNSPEVPPMSRQEIEKAAVIRGEYEKGKKILMKDNTVRIVHSFEEETQAKREDREVRGNA